MKNSFCFIEKALLVLELFTFLYFHLPVLFFPVGYCFSRLSKINLKVYNIQACNSACFLYLECFHVFSMFFAGISCFCQTFTKYFLNNKIEHILDKYGTVQSPLTFILPFSLVQLSVLLILFLCMLFKLL